MGGVTPEHRADTRCAHELWRKNYSLFITKNCSSRETNPKDSFTFDLARELANEVNFAERCFRLLWRLNASSETHLEKFTSQNSPPEIYIVKFPKRGRGGERK